MSEETIFNEVNEELRSERMRNLWRRFAPYVIGAAVAIVVLVAANEGWSWWQSSNAARSSDQFYSAIELAETGDIAGAQQALNTVIAEGSGQYPALAQFRQAALLAKDGRKTEAVAAYDALSTSLANQELRDLAFLLAGYTLVDNGDVNAVATRVNGLISPEHPMRNAAREAIGLTHYAAGDPGSARNIFEEIAADPTGSLEALGRIQLYLAQLTSEGAGPATAEAVTP